METKKLKVYFLGSGRIAVPPLEALRASSEVELVGVATQPDRQGGRGRRLIATPVGEWGAARGVAVEKPASVNAPEFIERLRVLAPDMVFLVAFGQILKTGILTLPPLGCVNMHASLLPRHRGASPIAAAIRSGDAATGVTFMRMEAGLDNGPVYLRCELPLTGVEYADTLEDELGRIGAESVIGVLRGISSGELTAVAQDHGAATYAGKIAKENGRVDWGLPAVEIERSVRAYHPWPGACCEVVAGEARRHLRITKAVVRPEVTGEPGTILVADKSRWIVACGDGSLELVKVVPEGKHEMSGTDFLRGGRLKAGDMLA